MSITGVQDLLLYSEIMAAIIGSVFYFRYKNTSLKYLLFILWLTVIIEQLGRYMAHNKVLLYENIYNYWLFNIYSPLSFFTFYYIYLKCLNSTTFKSWIKRFMIIYSVALIVNWVFLQNFFTELESYSFIVGALFLIVISIFYLIELLKSDKIIKFYKQLLFWISIGLLIFYSGIIPFVIAREFYSKLNFIHSLFLIIYILGIIMYSCFTIGFIWSRKE